MFSKKKNPNNFDYSSHSKFVAFPLKFLEIISLCQLHLTVCNRNKQFHDCLSTFINSVLQMLHKRLVYIHTFSIKIFKYCTSAKPLCRSFWRCKFVYTKIVKRDLFLSCGFWFTRIFNWHTFLSFSRQLLHFYSKK